MTRFTWTHIDVWFSTSSVVIVPETSGFSKAVPLASLHNLGAQNKTSSLAAAQLSLPDLQLLDKLLWLISISIKKIYNCLTIKYKDM